MRTKFKNPPINELIVGTYFTSEVPKLRAEHVGAFWATIRDEFPTIQPQLQVPAPHPTPPLPGVPFMAEIFPMPRYWLEAKDDPAFLMQIQRDAFLFNWRRRESKYPHYETVKAAFDRNLARYDDFLKREFQIVLPPCSIAELTYINLIEPCEYWKTSFDTANVVPRFRLPIGPATEEPPEFNQLTIERFASDLSIRTNVRTGKKASSPCLIIELRCTGPLEGASKETTDLWFDRAHVFISEYFLEMTSPMIQAVHWKPIDANV